MVLGVSSTAGVECVHRRCQKGGPHRKAEFDPARGIQIASKAAETTFTSRPSGIGPISESTKREGRASKTFRGVEEKEAAPAVLAFTGSKSTNHARKIACANRPNAWAVRRFCSILSSSAPRMHAIFSCSGRIGNCSDASTSSMDVGSEAHSARAARRRTSRGCRRRPDRCNWCYCLPCRLLLGLPRFALSSVIIAMVVGKLSEVGRREFLRFSIK